MYTVKVNPGTRIFKTMLGQFTQDPACIEDSHNSRGRDGMKDHRADEQRGSENRTAVLHSSGDHGHVSCQPCALT